MKPHGDGREELLQMIAEGNQDALAALYDDLSPTVFALAMHLVQDRSRAEDITHDLFVWLWREATRRTSPEVYCDRRQHGMSGLVSSEPETTTHSRSTDRR